MTLISRRNLHPVAAVALVCPLFGLPAPAQAETPTFQSLMDPRIFPEPQRGMRVEAAEAKGRTLRITTTGAELTLDADGGAFSFRQRIGHRREVVRVEIDSVAQGMPAMVHSGPGFAFVRFQEPRLDLRANGDSLFMFHARDPVRIRVRSRIEPGFRASWESCHLLLDEWGGFGLYCSHRKAADAFDPYSPLTATCELPADAVLWVGICPPKPYDWERSVRDHVVWHWSNRLAYPPDDTLASWAKHGNIVLLQSEVMLWKDWNLAFEPRLGAGEFARVRNTVHRLGMRFIVYTSPYYFLRGTPLEKNAMNSFASFTNWPAGTPTGENIDLFMAEITKLVHAHKPDGLYFDGQYIENPAALYALARRTRALLGEDGILEWHSTDALGPDMCFLPQADAYVDFVLRGEGRERLYGSDRYLRYFVSGYGSSNSIGVLCNNGSRPTRELVRRLIDVNARMHTLAGWLADPELVGILDTEYRPRMRDSLRAEVERGVVARQARVAEQARSLAAERRAILAPPAWGEPVLLERFASVPAWTPTVSPLNPSPFGIVDGSLAVTGRASTCAYLTQALNTRMGGLVVKLRCGTDGGQSWGPAACLRWPGGTFLRVGVRSDGLIQADLSGEQRVGDTADPKAWVWLRARWTANLGVIERSDDGRDFRRIWEYEHGGAYNGAAESVSVGKIPHNGGSRDHSDPGSVGTCFIGELALYPPSPRE